MINNIVLHGATNCESSNYGDFIYGDLIYSYLKEKSFNVSFYQPSSFFIKFLKGYTDIQTIDRKGVEMVIYIPGGYFGEGHQARFRDNLVHFLRFIPLGIWASFKKIPMAVLGIGAGPNNFRIMNYGIKRICNNSKFVSVRDNESYHALKNLCPKANIIESGDLIISKELKQKMTPQIDRIEKIRNGRKILLVHYNHSKEALEKFAEVVKKFVTHHNEFLVLVTSDSMLNYEDEFYNEFKDICEVECEHFIYQDPHEMTALLNKIDVVLTCKLHVGVVASTFGKSVVVAACHPEKTKRFYSQIGEDKRCISLFDSSELDILELLERYFNTNICIDESIINKSILTWELLDNALGEN